MHLPLSRPEMPASFAPHFHSRCWRAGRHGALAPQEVAEPDLTPLYRLRWQVYCEECGFVPAADHPQGLERDSHDAQAAHFGARNLRGELVGLSRLVFCSEQGLYPFELAGLVPHAGVQLLRDGQAAEVSRLMVRRDYRRRRGDGLSGVGDHSLPPQPRNERRQGSAQIVLSLYRQMFQYSRRAGIDTWYAAMERFLPLSLQRLGLAFERIGDEGQYHGPVAPYRQDLRLLEATLRERHPALLHWLQAPDEPAQGLS